MKTIPFAIGTIGIASALLAFNALAVEKPEVTESTTMIASAKESWRTCQGLPGCVFLPLRGDATREASEALFRLAAGTEFPRHWHTSPERVLVIQGTLVMNLENGERHRVGPRDYLYNPGGMVHWGECAQGADCVYYVHDEKPYDIHLVQ